MVVVFIGRTFIFGFTATDISRKHHINYIQTALFANELLHDRENNCVRAPARNGRHKRCTQKTDVIHTHLYQPVAVIFRQPCIPLPLPFIITHPEQQQQQQQKQAIHSSIAASPTFTGMRNSQ